MSEEQTQVVPKSDLKPAMALVLAEQAEIKAEQAEIKESVRALFESVSAGFKNPATTATDTAILAAIVEMKGVGDCVRNVEGALAGMALEQQAAREGKKVHEGKIVDRTFWEKTGDYAAPIATVAAGTLVGIGIYEGVRGVYSWATSDDEPINL